MTRIRRPLIGLVALFVGAIAVDRVGLESGGDAIGLTAYIVAATTIAAAFAVRGLRRSPWSLPVAAVATLLALAASGGTPGDPHALATEGAFIALSALMARSLARAVEEMDEALAVAAGGDSPATDIEGPEAANEIHTEMARSRRHDRPLSVTVLSPDRESLERALERAGPELHRALRQRFVLGRLARAVASQLRRSDLLFEHRASGRLYVLSPETDDTGIGLLRERVVAAASSIGLELAAGSASFPGDAISFEHLIEVAEQGVTAEAAPEPALRAVEESG